MAVALYKKYLGFVCRRYFAKDKKQSYLQIRRNLEKEEGKNKL